MTIEEALSGISGILVTPFASDDRIAPARLAPIVERCVRAGVDVLTVNGNTSEFYGLTLAEAESMQSEVAELVAGRAAVLAGVGRSVGEAARLAQRARADGAAAVMVHQPPDPFASPRGVVAYVQRVAAETDLPLVLYLRNDSIGRDAISALCAISGVTAVKWATSNLATLADAMRSAPGVGFICGLAETWAPAMFAVGARGFTSGLINVAPEKSVAVLAAIRAGELTQANTLIAEIAPFEALRADEQNGANVSVVKAALALMGQDVGPARPPSAWPLSPAVLDRIAAMIHGWQAADVAA